MDGVPRIVLSIRWDACGRGRFAGLVVPHPDYAQTNAEQRPNFATGANPDDVTEGLGN